MFKIPDHLVTEVKAGETFHVVKMGLGKASLGGQKVVIEVPSNGLKLGDRFFATGTNRLVRRLTLGNMVAVPDKNTTIQYKGRPIV